MSTTATLVQLAAELTLFVVAVAGVGLSARSGLLGLDRAARLLLVFGFAALAVSAFLIGSLTVERAAEPGALAAVRASGAVIVAFGAVRWAGSRRGRPLLLLGLLGLAAAAGFDATGIDLGATGLGGEVLVLASAVVMGAALVVAGRHTIPGRIGTSAAGVLLAVVLLVSLSLSAVISTTVEEEALRRYGTRASAEAEAAALEAEDALDAAALTAASLGARLGPDLLVLADPDRRAEAADARTRIAAALAALVGPDGLAIEDPVLVVDGRGVAQVAVPAALGGATRLALGGDPVVQEALEVDGPRQGVAVVATSAYALAAVPIRTSAAGARQSVGAVVVARPLDEAFLERRAASGEDVSLALVARDGVVAATGAQPPSAELARRARAVIDGGSGFAGDRGGRYLVVRPVTSGGLPPQLTLVLSTPAERVGRTREDLYRSLFAVALAAGLAGIALSIVVGERIGGAIRRLTAAAARIREGDLTARAAVDREDELGELSETFDSMAGSVHDLTDDLRLAAASEARLRGRLESVFAGVAEAVVAADEQRRVTELNLAAVELLGLDEDDEDLDGRSLDEVVPLVGTDGEPVSLSAPSGGARVVVGTVRPANRPDAPPTPVVGTVASLHDAGGGRAGTVVVLRDVRRERALEEAKQDFLANIGHELRTPLTPIKGYAGVLRRRTPTPEQAREWSEGISAGVERLEHLVERLVTFAAVTAGPVGTSPSGGEPVDVAALVAAVADHWRPRLDRPLVVEVPGDLPPLRGEPAHLRLALGELVDNAARFSPPGTPVTIRATLVPAGDGAGPEVEVAVHDEGGGDLAGLAGAVDAFTQGEASATRRHEGLGLGLALVDRVARAHGGRLTLAARTDGPVDADGAPSHGGTTVSILVPVVTASAGPATAPVSAPTDPAPDEGVAP